MSKAISKILIAIILFFTFPAESFSLNLSSNVIVNSVSPIEELKPLKNKKRRTEKVKKNVYSKFK